MTDQYELIPTSKQRGSRPPPGWVQLVPGMNPKRRTMTEGYLNQRMPRGNTVAKAKVGIESVRANCAAPVEDQTVEGYEVLRHPKYEVYLDVGGKPRFRLKASNGEIIAVSQAYADKPSCMKGIASIGSHAPDAEIVIEDPE